MEGGQKRKADTDVTDTRDKRMKTKKQWRVPRKNDHGASHARSIQPGDSGIWATCNKGKEGKCIGELRDLFTEYAGLFYGEPSCQDVAGDESANEDGGCEPDIEKEIEAEVAGIRKPESEPLFTHVRVDVQCGIWL